MFKSLPISSQEDTPHHSQDCILREKGQDANLHTFSRSQSAGISRKGCQSAWKGERAGGLCSTTTELFLPDYFDGKSLSGGESSDMEKCENTTRFDRYEVGWMDLPLYVELEKGDVSVMLLPGMAHHHSEMIRLRKKIHETVRQIQPLRARARCFDQLLRFPFQIGLQGPSSFSPRPSPGSIKETTPRNHLDLGGRMRVAHPKQKSELRREDWPGEIRGLWRTSSQPPWLRRQTTSPSSLMKLENVRGASGLFTAFQGPAQLTLLPEDKKGSSEDGKPLSGEKTTQMLAAFVKGDLLAHHGVFTNNGGPHTHPSRDDGVNSFLSGLLDIRELDTFDGHLVKQKTSKMIEKSCKTNNGEGCCNPHLGYSRIPRKSTEDVVSENIRHPVCAQEPFSDAENEHSEKDAGTSVMLFTPGPLETSPSTSIHSFSSLKEAANSETLDTAVLGNSFDHNPVSSHESYSVAPYLLLTPLNEAEINKLSFFSKLLSDLYRARGELLRRIDRIIINHAQVHELWESSEAHAACYSCGRSFSVCTRRHHCRRCGHLCCAKCSQFLGKRQDTSATLAHAVIKTEYAARMTADDTGDNPEECFDTHTYVVSESSTSRGLTTFLAGRQPCDLPSNTTNYAHYRAQSENQEDKYHTKGSGNRTHGENGSVYDGNVERQRTWTLFSSFSHDNTVDDAIYEINREETIDVRGNNACGSYGNPPPNTSSAIHAWLRICKSCYRQCSRARERNVLKRMRNANRIILDDGLFYFHVLSQREQRSIWTYIQKPDSFKKKVELQFAVIPERVAESVKQARYHMCCGIISATARVPQFLKTVGDLGVCVVRTARYTAKEYCENTNFWKPLVATTIPRHIQHEVKKGK
ncbi:unnamed protein product [Phytomonas sp. Hart1]|nr:unnamed protein product [Phytomonas sp. Hart1]|eukprot:CCW71903.1 unnamed protein product [Phytomonas sp. isolate Hart1]